MSRSRSRSKSKTKRSPSRGESKERDAKKVGCSFFPVTGGQKETLSVTLLKLFPFFSPRVTPNLGPGLQPRKMEIQGDQGALYDDSCAAHDMMCFY